MESNVSPPDGGWGWMVVIGAALINMVNQAMFANFGLIFGEQLKAMAGGHATGITTVMAINVVITNFAGLLVGPLLKVISIRTLTFIGIFFVGTGLIISSFATEIFHIVIGYSCLTGLGLGVMASGTFLAINDYFTSKKSTAVGISMAGTAVGQMIMPTFIGMLLERYGFSSTTFILGFLSYTGVIGAMFFKPVLCCKKWAANDSETGKTNNTNEEKLKDEIGNGVKHEEEKLLDNSKAPEKVKQGMIKHGIEKNYHESTFEIASSRQKVAKTVEEKEGCIPKTVKLLGLNLLEDLSYIHILIGLSFVYVSTFSFGAFFPMFLQDEAQFTLMQTTYCMTALSSADVVGRITVSELFRRLKLSNRTAFMTGCILLGISRSCLVEMEKFEFIIVASALTGYFRAITVINQNLVISEYIAKDKLPSAVGLNMVSKAIMTLTFGQSLGLITDQWSYGMCIHFLDVIIALVVLSWTLETLIKQLRK